MSNYSDKRKESNQKWDKANIYRMTIALPIEVKPLIQAYAKEQNKSVHNFVISCIEHETGLVLHVPESERKHNGGRKPKNKLNNEK